MSYRKRPYRDKKYEVLAESEKLRKDIESLEDALALHTRHKVEEENSIKGIIRKELGSSRWEYGGEGKLTTFRSARDLTHEPTEDQRLSSRGSKTNNAQPSTKKSIRGKRSERERHMVKSLIEDVAMKRLGSFHVDSKTGAEIGSCAQHEASIADIAFLLNDIATGPSKATDKTKSEYEKSEPLRHPKGLNAVDSEKLKAKVLSKASTKVIHRKDLSSSKIDTKSISTEGSDNRCVDRLVIPHDSNNGERIGLARKDKHAYKSSVARKGEVTQRNNPNKIQRGRDPFESTNENLGSKNEKGLYKTLSPHSQPKELDTSLVLNAVKLETNNYIDQANSQRQIALPVASSRNLDQETDRPLSRSQTSKASLLYKLYGEPGSPVTKTSPKLSDQIADQNDVLALFDHKQQSIETTETSSHRSAKAEKPPLPSTINVPEMDESQVEKNTDVPPCDPEVKNWLDGLGLQSLNDYQSIFSKNIMDMSSVKLLTPESLRDMGIQALGPIMKIMKGVHVLNRGNIVTEEELCSKSLKDNDIDIGFNIPTPSRDPVNQRNQKVNIFITESSTKPRMNESQSSKACVAQPVEEHGTNQVSSTSPSSLKPKSVSTKLKEHLSSEDSVHKNNMNITDKVEDQMSSGKKSSRQAKARGRAAGTRVTSKPPVSCKLADTGISTAVQRISARHRKQQEQQQAEQEAVALQKKRRDEMAAKHVRRRSSSAERDRAPDPGDRVRRSSLRRSASFTEVFENQQHDFHQSNLSFESDGILTGRGLNTKRSSRKPTKASKPPLKSERGQQNAANESDIIFNALLNFASPQKETKTEDSILSRKSNKGVLSLGQVRELQTRLSCLEEQLVEGASNDTEKEIQLRGNAISAAVPSNPPVNAIYETREMAMEIKGHENPNSSEEHKSQWKTSQRSISLSLGNSDADLSVTDLTGPEVLQDNSIHETQMKKDLNTHKRHMDYMAHRTSTPVAKQRKGHYYGVKRGFNFQSASRPPEMCVSYQVESLNQVVLNKDDICYVEDDLCGEGAFSKVFKGTFQESKVAVKRLKTALSPKDKSYFAAEVAMLRELRHPHVVMLLGMCTSDTLPVIVLEYMTSGTLHCLLHEEGRPVLSADQFYQICEDVSSGMLYLHERHPPVLHLELKTKNVLLGEGNRAKVADFGFSKLKHEADMKVSRMSRALPLHSAPYWMAPELLTAGEITAKADVYSFGILLWEAYVRKIPYAGCSVFQILEQVRLNRRPSLPTSCPTELSQLIYRCWDQNPAVRPGFTEIVTLVQLLAKTCLWAVPELPKSSDKIATIKDQELHPTGKCLSEVYVGSGQEEQENIKPQASIQIQSETGHPPTTSSLSKPQRTPRPGSGIRPKTAIVHALPQESEYVQTNNKVSPCLPVGEMVANADEVPTSGRKHRVSNDEKGFSTQITSSHSSPRALPPSFPLSGQEKSVTTVTSTALPSSEKSASRFASTDQGDKVEEDDEVAKKLIARYMPQRALAPSLTKSYDHDLGVGTSEKLLPLRHSLDRPKALSKNVGSVSPFVKESKQDAEFRPHETHPHGSAASSRVEISRTSPRVEKSNVEKIHVPIVMRKSSTNIGHLRKGMYSHISDGQPYVPSFYDELQKPKVQKKPSKYHSAGQSIEARKQKTQSERETRIKPETLSDNFEAQSQFMKYLNATCETAKQCKQSNSSSLPKNAGEMKTEVNSINENEEFTVSGYKDDKKLNERGEVNNLLFEKSLETEMRPKKQLISQAEKKNPVLSKSSSYVELEPSTSSTQPGLSEAGNRPPSMVEESRDLCEKLYEHSVTNNSSKFQDEDMRDHNPGLILDLSDISSVPNSRRSSVYSSESSSDTPDGMSEDSLSLTLEESSVVDSLEFPGLSPQDSIDIPKLSLNPSKVNSSIIKPVPRKIKNSKEETIRQSFFLFDDSEISEPFDILNSATSQRETLNERLKIAHSSDGGSLNTVNVLSEMKEKSQSLNRTSKARQRAREKRQRGLVGEEKEKLTSSSTPAQYDHNRPAPILNLKKEIKPGPPSKPKNAKSIPPLPDSKEGKQREAPSFSITGEMLSKGKQLLKPATKVDRNCDNSSGKLEDPLLQFRTQQRFSIDAGLLQYQKGQLRSVETKLPDPAKSMAQGLYTVSEDGLPSMANILKKALDDRRLALGDNIDSQDFTTPEASWSLQDD